jgi:hypothetical protein
MQSITRGISETPAWLAKCIAGAWNLGETEKAVNEQNDVCGLNLA